MKHVPLYELGTVHVYYTSPGLFLFSFRVEEHVAVGYVRNVGDGFFPAGEDFVLECSTIHSPPALFFFLSFFLFWSGD